MSEPVSLAAIRSQRRSDETNHIHLFSCTACHCYSFKIIELAGTIQLACANCEAWIREFDLVPTRALD